MRRVKVTLPATITNPGPAINCLGLALGMHTVVEFTERRDENLVVEPTGEGAGDYSVGLRHPVVLGLLRVFQRLERAPLGLTVRIDNRIPVGSGLGSETAFLVAGVIGANNLLGNPLTREQILQLAAQATQQPDRAVTTIRGGLTSSLLDGDTLTWRSLPVAPLRVVVALPELDNYGDEIEGVVPDRALLDDVLYNLGLMPMLLDALREGDHKRLGQAMHDRLYSPFYRPFIPGYDHVVEMAKRQGAQAFTFTGRGPAIVMFAEANHRKIADAVQQAFENSGVTSRVWVLPVDTQGVVVSVAQST